jgi:hypothetical protein
MPRLVEYRITDDLRLRNEIAIEVDVLFDSGERRWCYFMTPQALATCGDLLKGSRDVRVHPGVQHMIVCSRLDEEIVENTLQQLDREDELYVHTVPYE